MEDIISRFTLKEKLKLWIGIHDRFNFECISYGRKIRVHLHTTKQYPYGYVEVLK
jgi:hypothetical protein